MLNNIKWHKIHGLSETVVNGRRLLKEGWRYSSFREGL